MKTKRKYNKKILIGALVTSGLLVFLMFPIHLALLADPYSTILEDKNGELLSAQIAADGQWRFPMSEEELPQKFVECITTFEDKRFLHHFGVDPIAIIRALRQNIKAKKIVSGGSTLTMQILRMSNDHSKRNVKNKVIEAIQAVRLEFQKSKNEILKIYATHAPFGGNVVGLETASWKYFNKRPSDLSWAQMATLCVLPNSPSLIRMDRNEDHLLMKRNFLLSKLGSEGIIDEMELDLALSEPLNYGKYPLPYHAPHLLQKAKKQDHHGRIKTTIDISYQQKMNELLDYHYPSLSAKGIHNAAVLIMDTRTQEIISYAANIPSTTEEADVNTIDAPRSSGSILKPFLYAAVVEEGVIAPDALVKDVPVFLDGFNPKNYHDDFAGIIPASQALSRSLNVPFVLMLQEYGVEKFRRELNKIGLSTVDQSGDHYGLSLILGGAEVRLDQLTTAYAHMGRSLYEYDQNKAKYTSSIYPHSYFIPTQKGATKPKPTLSKIPVQSFSASSIYHTFEAMKNVLRPNGHGDWELFPSSKEIAWKTGTSFGHRDAWAVGTHPQYTIGVWVGNADGEGRNEIIGSTTAGKVLFDAFDKIHLEKGWWATPYDEMDQIDVCISSGMLPSPNCLDRTKRWISKASIKTKVCHYHKIVWTNEDKDYVVDQSCYDMEKAVRSSYMNLSPLVHKYYRRHAGIYTQIPPYHPDCQNLTKSQSPIEMVYPNPSERIYIPNDLNAARQEVIAQLEHSNPEAEVFWYLNGDYLGATRDFHTMSIDAMSGEYALLVTDGAGNEVRRYFEITGDK